MNLNDLLSIIHPSYIQVRRNHAEEFFDTLFDPGFAGPIIISLGVVAVLVLLIVFVVYVIKKSDQDSKPIETKTGILIDVFEEGTAASGPLVRHYVFECENGDRIRVRRSVHKPVNIVKGDTCTFQYQGEMLLEVSDINQAKST